MRVRALVRDPRTSRPALADRDAEVVVADSTTRPPFARLSPARTACSRDDLHRTEGTEGEVEHGGGRAADRPGRHERPHRLRAASSSGAPPRSAQFAAEAEPLDLVGAVDGPTSPRCDEGV